MLKNLLLFLAIILSINIWAQIPDLPSGIGTSENPYQIATLNNLYWITQNSGSWGSHFIQTADIDASSTSTWQGGSGLSPIGNSSIKFTGTYDGDSFTIDEININRPTTDKIGLFGFINNALVENLNLTNSNIIGKNYVGGLIGWCTNSLLDNCHVSGTVAGTSYVAGLTGLIYNGASVNLCSSSSDVTGAGSHIGGLIGEAYASVQNSIDKSYSSGTISATGLYIGGFAGNFNGTNQVNDCYSLATVVGSSNVGGFTGRTQGATGDIINCYSAGSVTGTSDIGGFVGVNYLNQYSFSSCYWNTTTSGEGTSAAGTGVDNDAMTNQATFVGWNFTSIWAINSGINDGYPYLQNNAPPVSFITWDGSESAAWNTAGNWDGGSVPTSSEDVVIANAGTPPVIASGVGADCKNLTINSEATLTVASGGSIIPTGTITNNGTFNVQHSMADGKWHFVSSPVSGATANVFNGDYLQYFVESSATYYDISDAGTALNACQGYTWRNFSKGNFTFSGTPYHGNQSINTTDSDDWGWNLVGNPYPSSLDWNILDDTYGTIYTFVDNGVNSGWRTYNNGTSVNGGVRYVAPMQAFFIATSGAGSFAVSNSNRTHSGATGYVKSKEKLSNYIKLKARADEQYDEFVVQFGENYQTGFDQIYDAWKMGAESLEYISFYSKCEDGNLSIDRRPETETIQLGFNHPSNTMASIEIYESFDLGNIQIEDTKLNTLYDLTAGAYNFNWETTDSEERFVLHLKATGVLDQINNRAQVYAAHGQLVVRVNEYQKFENIQIFDLAGKLFFESSINSESLQSFEIGNTSGVFLVQLKGQNKSETHKVIL